jgi:hypothetical protein
MPFGHLQTIVLYSFAWFLRDDYSLLRDLPFPPVASNKQYRDLSMYWPSRLPRLNKTHIFARPHSHQLSLFVYILIV